MDFTLIGIFKWTGAFEYYPEFRFVDATVPGNGISPFSSQDEYHYVGVISLGFLIVLVLTIPMGYFNLDDNIIVQVLAFFGLLIIFVVWFIEFLVVGLDFDRVPVAGPDQTQVLGTIIFNYAFVITIPSWVNEKSENVPINSSIWASTIVSTGIYIVIGLFGGWAFQYTGSQDLLDALTQETSGGWQIVSQISVYAFPIIALLSGIPIISIIVRYNLLENKICGKGWANFWGVLFPWLVAFPLCTGEGIQILINWTSLFVNGLVNFIIPLLLYVMTTQIEIPFPSFSFGVNEAIEEEIPVPEDQEPYFALPCLEEPKFRHSKYHLYFNPLCISIVLITLFIILLIMVIILNFYGLFSSYP